jgi:hypothetical protein
MTIEMSYEQKECEAIEYVSMLLSVQLAVAFNKSKPNTAIKNTLKSVIKRTESERIKAICRNGARSAFAKGWLARELNNIGRNSHFSREEFIKIGASLEGTALEDKQ